MDVPFVSSGALSRSHYTLVKSIESAQSPQMADSYILKEVESIRYRLRHPTISLKETRESLLVLLYCSMSISSPALPTGSLDFALPQAVNLAEAGKTVHEKRIGYLFCAELMSPTHELRLMLVNTLRKDLESPTTALICLSLDNLIMSPSEDVIPAVQSRLQDLLSNPSPHVRRRALLACSALARYEPDLLRRITSKVLKRLRDQHLAVVGAALTVSLELYKLNERARNDIKDTVNALLQTSWPNHHNQSTRCIVLQILDTLRTVGVHAPNLGLISQIIQSTSKSSDHPVMYAAFRVLSNVDASETTNSQSRSPATDIRELLTSRSVNDQYIFLACLACLKPEVWAGTDPEIPAVLEQWEVGRVMELLDSSDTAIRRKTLAILTSIDPNIVHSYYSQSLQTLPADLNLSGLGEYTTRLLEVIELQAEGDGEQYARQLVDLFAQMEARSPRYAQLVMENAVEKVLIYLRNGTNSFQIGCVTTLVTFLANTDTFLGQTMMVIIPALATEYAGKLSVAPPEVLRGLSTRLPLCSLAVQDACLLAMLRISAECEQVPSDVVISINDLGNQSGRHIRQRCEDFTTLSAQKDVLGEIIQSAGSSALPDFLQALHRYKIQSSTKTSLNPAPLQNLPRRRQALPVTNSDTPRMRLLRRRHVYVTAGPRAAGSSRSGSSQLSLDELARTVTAGDLTLAAAAETFELQPRAADTRPAEPQSPHAADLIAFNDSPFISDPSADTPSDFESMWNGFDESSSARGWCDVSLEDVIKRLESMEDTLKVISAEELPFVGDLKILLNGGDPSRGIGVLRLRASEEGGCLWRMRSGGLTIRRRVKSLLTAMD
ncbi:armadillo-type protein [Mycena filopes]|nr:armadillo-type protein [Mycena filopes]